MSPHARQPRKTTRLDLEIQFSIQARRLTRPQQHALLVRLYQRLASPGDDRGRVWWIVDPAGGKFLL